MNNRKKQRINPSQLVDCLNCIKTGIYPGVFEGMICDPCDGNGVLDKETGDTVDKELWVIALLSMLKKQDLQIAWYKQKLEMKKKGHFENLKTVNGGRLRLD